MTEPQKPPLNRRYHRRFGSPEQWPSNRRGFGDKAVEKTRETVNELSWGLAAEQLADEITAVLAADFDRQERRRRALGDGWMQGEPGE